MRKICAVFLAVALLAALLPAGMPAASAARAAPAVEVRNNRLYYGGRTLSMIDCIQTFKVLYVAKADRSKVTRQMLDEKPDNPPVAQMIYINPESVRNAYTAKAKDLTLSAGDALFFALKPSGREGYSAFAELVLTAGMFGAGGAPSGGALPALELKGGSLVISPANIHTEYEYAIYPKDAASGFAPEWIPVGSASAAGSTTITVPLRPCSYEHTIRVRAAGDEGGRYASVAGKAAASPVLSVPLETIAPLPGGKDGCYWYLSADGGKKYQKLYVPAGEDGQFDLSRVFGKNKLELVLKKSAKDEKPEEIGAVVLRATVNPRASFSKEYRPVPYVNEQYPYHWTLSGLPKNASLEYRVAGSESWVPFPADTGLSLLTEAEQAIKKKAQKYEFRVAASEGTSTPASTVKKFTQPKQIKRPKLKLDYKKELVKLKSGVFYAFSEDDDASADELEFLPSDGEVSLSDAITEGQTIYVYTGETEKKSRSAVVSATPAGRAETPDGDECIVLEKGKAKLMKGFEAYGSKNKWGSLAKGETAVLIRRKSEAKYNAKTGETAGEAASLPIEAKITYAADGKSVASVDAQRKKELIPASIRIRTRTNCAVTGRSGSDVEVLESGVYRYTLNLLTLRDSLGDAMTCEFELTLTQPKPEGGTSPAGGIVIAKNGQTLSQNEWSASLRSVRLGDSFTVTLLPRDRNTHRETVFTFGVLPPVMDAPTGAAWGSDPAKGTVRVTLANPLYLGDYAKLRFELVKTVNGEQSVVHTATKDFKNTEQPSGMLVVQHDLSREITAAGIGRYHVNVTCVGTPGVWEDSAPASSPQILVYREDIAPKYAALTGGELQAGSRAGVERILNALGASVTASVQWITSTHSPSATDAGTPIPGATGAAYTVTEAEEGLYLGARISGEGGFLTKWFDGPVRRGVRIETPGPRVEIAGDGTLEFAVRGLGDPLLAGDAQAEAVSVSFRTDPGQTAATFGPLTVDGGTVRLPVTAASNGEVRVSLVVTVGASVPGYVRTGEFRSADVLLVLSAPEPEEP